MGARKKPRNVFCDQADVEEMKGVTMKRQQGRQRRLAVENGIRCVQPQPVKPFVLLPLSSLNHEHRLPHFPVPGRHLLA